MSAENLPKHTENNQEKHRNYVELTEQQKLTEQQILEKIIKDLTPIQDSLVKKQTEEKRLLTIEQAEKELKYLNERLKWSKLDQNDKERIWIAFDNLIKNLNKNIDKAELNAQINEIIKEAHESLNSLKEEEKELKQSIIGPLYWTFKYWTHKRSKEVKTWIDNADKNLVATIDNASKDSNIIARTVWKRMKNLIS